jgi:hypothetical protein
MLKRVQHDKKKCVIPNLFRNLDSGNVNKLIAFVLVEKGIHHGEFLEMVGVVGSGEKEGKERLTRCVT